MQTLQPTLRLGRDVWNAANMPATEFQARAERLRAEMARAGLDALLLYGNSLDGCGYPTYLSNYTVKLPFAALVILPRDSAPVLIFQGSTRGQSAAQATTWIEDTRPCWNLAETCAAAMAEKNLLRAAVGIAGVVRLMPYEQWQTLSAALSQARLVDAEPLVDRQRAIKSPREIAQVRRASQIVERTFESLEGRNEALIAAGLMRAARMQGAEDVRVLFGQPNEPFRPAEDAVIPDADTVIIYLAASWERYWSQAIRTYTGFRWNRTGEDAFHALVAKLKPGLPVAELARTAGDGADPTFLRDYGLGHGIGTAPKEPPFLTPDCSDTIEYGMCFAIRLALPDPAAGLVVHGGTFVVAPLQNKRS